MPKFIKLILLSLLVSACAPKLKIVDAHTTIFNKYKKNFYLKDENRSYERLKGTWIWSRDNDTLIIEAVPKYKQSYQKIISKYENSFYDTAVLNIKYIQEGKTIVDSTKQNIIENCLIVGLFKVQTNVFYLDNLCQKDNGSYLILNGDNMKLFLVSPNSKGERILLKEEGQYEIKIPKSIILDRVSFD